MTEYTKLIERLGERYGVPDLSTDQLLNRRDRKRRNQRITAGVVGIAVFVAAVWIVTSVGSLDRSENSVVPAGTGPVQTGATQTAPAPARASAAPDVVTRAMCSFLVPGVRSRMELTDVGSQIAVRFVLHDEVNSDLDLWRIELRHRRVGTGLSKAAVFFLGPRWPEGDSGYLAVQRRVPDLPQPDAFLAKAFDPGTGQVCKVYAELW